MNKGRVRLNELPCPILYERTTKFEYFVITFMIKLKQLVV